MSEQNKTEQDRTRQNRHAKYTAQAKACLDALLAFGENLGAFLFVQRLHLFLAFDAPKAVVLEHSIGTTRFLKRGCELRAALVHVRKRLACSTTTTTTTTETNANTNDHQHACPAQKQRRDAIADRTSPVAACSTPHARETYRPCHVR